jgi:Ca2+-binding RTX toxin-like protein
MSSSTTNKPRLARLAQHRVAAAAGAGTLALLLAIGAQPVAAASTVKVAIVNGTLLVTGTPSRDRIALRLSRSHPNRIQVDVGDNGTADHTFRLGAFARIDVEAGRGNDRIRIDSRNGIFTNARPTRIHGGKGNDTLIGGDGRETLFGDSGDDVVDGNGGADTVVLGGGTDTVVWNPGDGPDVVRGGSGSDTLVFSGSADDEFLTAAANAGRVSFSRDLATGDGGSTVLSLDDVEAIHVRALGGNDEITIGDLSGTDLARVDVDLAAPGGTSPDGQADTVAVSGTDGDDTLAVTASGGTVSVNGLATSVRVSHADPDADKLAIDTLGGLDSVTVDPAVSALINVSGS